MHLQVDHHTVYHYREPLPYGVQQLRLLPRSDASQVVHDWRIELEGAEQEVAFDDHHGNRVLLIRSEPGAESVSMAVTGRVETMDRSGITGPHQGFVPLWLYRRSTDLTRPGPGIEALLEGLDDVVSLEGLHTLSDRILEAVPYMSDVTNACTRAEEAMAAGHGVCQDHAHIFVAACRLAGCPARYVSGYLYHTGEGAEMASHAWAEAHVPDLGWVGFDVSNGLSPNDHYVRVAVGLDYADAAPVTGIHFGGVEESMDVLIQVDQ